MFVGWKPSGLGPNRFGPVIAAAVKKEGRCHVKRSDNHSPGHDLLSKLTEADTPLPRLHPNAATVHADRLTRLYGCLER